MDESQNIEYKSILLSRITGHALDALERSVNKIK